MLDLNDTIELYSTDAKNSLTFNIKYLVQINFTLNITIQSSAFTGVGEFCIRKDQIQKNVDELKKMLTLLQGTTKIEDNDSANFLEFAIDTHGRVFITGQIADIDRDNDLRFKFSTDNISVDNFIIDFKRLLNYVDDEEYEKSYK